MKKISRKEFDKMLRAAMNDGSSCRVGQLLYVEICENYPDISEEITGTKYDPFDNDEAIYDLMNHISE